MSDLASDARVNQLLLAQPLQVATLADFLTRAAAESDRTATGLRAAQHDGLWHGQAADTFRNAIGRMPGRLDTIGTGFAEAGAALSTYAGAVARIQAAFGLVAGELQDCSAQLGPARTAADAARTMLRRLLYTPGVGRSALLAAQGELERTDANVGSINDVVVRLRARAHGLLDEFEQQRAECRSRLALARCLAPRAPVQWRLGSQISAQPAPPA